MGLEKLYRDDNWTPYRQTLNPNPTQLLGEVTARTALYSAQFLLSILTTDGTPEVKDEIIKLRQSEKSSFAIFEKVLQSFSVNDIHLILIQNQKNLNALLSAHLLVIAFAIQTESQANNPNPTLPKLQELINHLGSESEENLINGIGGASVIQLNYLIKSFDLTCEVPSELYDLPLSYVEVLKFLLESDLQNSLINIAHDGIPVSPYLALASLYLNSLGDKYKELAQTITSMTFEFAALDHAQSPNMALPQGNSGLTL